MAHLLFTCCQQELKCHIAVYLLSLFFFVQSKIDNVFIEFIETFILQAMM